MSSRGGTDLIGRRSEALVLEVARRRETADRASLAAQTGLTPQAISNVLARLISAGYIEVAGSRQDGVGKPTTVYRLRETSHQAIGVQVTLRGVRFVRVDLRGQVRSHEWHDLPSGFSPEDVIALIRDGAERLEAEIADEAGVLAGAGIGMIGPLDQRHGIVRDATGLPGWHDVALREMAEQALGVPVSLDKDVTAAAVGEAWTHHGDAGDTALILIEGGVGAGLWLRQAAFRGAHTNAGEFGHSVIERTGPGCVCGRRGCVEIMHSTARDRGDVDEAAQVIAAGALNLIQTLDVKHVVLGGADFLRHERVYLSALRAAISQYWPATTWRSVQTRAAVHGANCVAVGAAVQVLQEQCFGLADPSSGSVALPSIAWPASS